MQHSQYSNDSYFPSSVLFNQEFQQEYLCEPELEEEISNQWISEYGLLSPPFDLSQVALPSTSNLDDDFLPHLSYHHSSQSSLDSSRFNTFALPPLINSQQNQQQSTPAHQFNNNNLSQISYCATPSVNSDSDYYIPRVFATLPTPLPSPTLSCHSSIYPSEAPEFYDFGVGMEMDSPAPALSRQLSYESQYQQPAPQQQQVVQQVQPRQVRLPQQQEQSQRQVVDYHQESEVHTPSSSSSIIQTPSPQREASYVTYVDLPRSNPTGAEGSCTPFVSKLAYLLRNPELYQDVILWDKHGKTFIIAPSPKMIDEVLPNIFLHSSLAAFTRQLNTYGFKRLDRDSLAATFSHSPDTFTPLKELSAWSHPNFQRDRPSSLNLLTPKPSRARELHRKGKLLVVESTYGMAASSKAVYNKVKVAKKDKTYKS